MVLISIRIAGDLSLIPMPLGFSCIFLDSCELRDWRRSVCAPLQLLDWTLANSLTERPTPEDLGKNRVRAGK